MLGIELTPEHPVGRLAELAVATEGEGFDTVFVSHHYNNRDEFAVLAALAEATDSIQLGPGVTNPYETHPVTLASRMATVDELSEGRGVFGLGAGDRSTLANLGFDRERPLSRVLETMQVARRLWAGERVDHDGTFTVADAGLNYDVGSVPVYVGAQGPDMTRMAAKYADGILYNGSHPRDVEWASERVSEGLSDRDGGESSFDFVAYASVSVAETGERAREAARPPVAFIAGGAPGPVLTRHGIDESRAQTIGENIEAGEFSAAFDLVTERMIDAFCIAGTPGEVSDQVSRLLETADGVVLGSPLGPDIEEAITLLGESFPANQE
jgi:5,10-methylenetetrahydromethanopterin reductase